MRHNYLFRPPLSMQYPSSEALVLLYAHCLLAHGAPGFVIESRLASLAARLDTPTHFIILPGVILLTFAKGSSADSANFHRLQRHGSISLSSLDMLCRLSKAPVDTPQERMNIAHKLRSLDIHTTTRLHLRRDALIAWLTSFVITLLAFHGSIIDAVAAGTGAAALGLLSKITMQPQMKLGFE